MKRKKASLSGDVCSGDCPSRGILDHVTSRWSTLIMVMLLERTHRFSKLAQRIGGVSERMLAHSLRTLEADGFVLRVVYPTKPPKVEYSLTELGREAALHIQALTQWVEANFPRVLQHRQAQAKREKTQAEAINGKATGSSTSHSNLSRR